MSFTNRNKIQNSRGPNRHRWEPKQPSPSLEKVTMVGIGVLGCFLMFVFLLQTWSSSHHGFLRSSDPTTLHHLPLRGHRINHAESHLILPNADAIFLQNQPLPIADAIVVGSGLAGLTAALTILDRGGTVLIVEKEPIMGGNSNKASSGINGCCWDQQHQTHPVSSATNDTLELFMQDTLRSAGTVADEELIETLVTHSAPTLDWLQERVGVDLTAPLVILGGHSRKRTHRPNVGFVGAEIMNAMETAIRSFEMDGSVQILVGHKVTRIIQDTHGTVKGVEVESVEESSYENTPPQNLLLRSDHVILATGGFASDRSQNSLLRQYRPELQNMAATAGTFSTGDGIHLAEQLQAATRDMEKIQIHPTGFVDPTDPRNPQKVLAAELLRGVGGILLNSRGERFANELGTRDYVTDRMLQHDDEFRRRRTWNPDTPIPQFDLLLSSTAAKNAEKHVDTYMRKGLIHKFYGINELARNLQVSQDRLASTIRDYQLAAMGEREDAFGRSAFENVFD
jgi:flavocytochrome c